MRSDVSANTPRHIGIIMDGNGRWATKRLRPRTFGHRAGVKNITSIVAAAVGAGVKYITLYAFSTENKARDKEEVDGLVDIMRKQLRPMCEDLNSKGARVMVSGDISYFPTDVREIIKSVTSVMLTPDASVVNIALNYGGREEIVRAARLAAEKGEISAETLERELYTAGVPDPDMIIRTGGEKRISNFLLYQSAYSELFFTDTLWPDFKSEELLAMLEEFNHRTRRFGK